jgi:hypothetical protein
MVLNRTWNFKNLHRIMCLALCLGVVCFALAGNAWAAGTTRLSTVAPTSPDTFAKELTYKPTTGGNVYKLVTNGNYSSNIYRDMTVARLLAQNFDVQVTLGGGAVFSGGTVPVNGDLTLTFPVGTTGAYTSTVVMPVGGWANATSFIFQVTVTADFTGYPTIKIAAGDSGWTIKDPLNTLATGTIPVTVTTLDASSLIPIDNGANDTLNNWIAASPAYSPYASGGGLFTATTAMVDVATGRKNFVVTATDGALTDGGASMGVSYSANVLTLAGTAPFVLVGTDSVKLTFTDTMNFAGVSSVTWGGFAAGVSGTTRVISLTPAQYQTLVNTIAPAPAFVFTVDGTTPLATRTISVKQDIIFGVGQSIPSPLTPFTFAYMANTTVTTWSVNGTVLVANWLNGNTNLYNSRIYIYNSSGLPGDVTVRVLKLPAAATGTTVVTSTDITPAGGPIALGTLAPGAGMNIRAEVDLLPLLTAITLPYYENGGNLIVEITVKTNGARGTCQVFKKDGTLAFGVVDLQVVQ